ncbi:hypothetical protein BGX33_002249 [Mortierella sp. NVP41]|nr:hypothetical protein BGX33_002249 [Mortierella sp. NVP41]
MQSRLKYLLARGKDQYAQQSLVHGYMFDAWSGRRCSDQFLDLTAKWPLSTDAYLKLLTELGLGDQLLATLLTFTHQESLRLAGMILRSPEVTADLLGSLFVWTVDQVETTYRRRAAQIQQQQEGFEASGRLIRLWVDQTKECENIRRLFRVSFRRVLSQLMVRQSRRHRGGISYWGLGDKDQDDSSTHPGVADEIIQGLLADIIAILVEHPSVEGECDFAQDIYEDLRRWDQLFTGFGTKLSELLPASARSPKRKRTQEETTTKTYKDRLSAVLQKDAEFMAAMSKRVTTPQDTGLQQPPRNDHQEAFISICDNLRRNQDLPGYPPMHMSRLVSYKIQDTKNRGKVLQEHIEWVESTIHNRSAGWLSCAKLKIQFFAVFGETHINEELADIICEHNLHWDLCSTLLRYLRRHRADPMRMPAETFQLGCELLLSVFTKRVGLRLSLRDHLFHQSNTARKDATGPLFGSWDFWRMNIDTLLTSTLNQVVVSEDSPQSSAVSPHTIEALVKISLIAPYQVIARMAQSIIVNRGQCALLLQAILGLGQLAWLRVDPTQPTLLVAVLQHFIHRPTTTGDAGLTWSEQQQDNFVDFVVQAMGKRSNATGMLLLDPTEFLTECVTPFLDKMEAGQPSLLFQAIARILLKIYERGPVEPAAVAVIAAMVVEGERQLLPSGIQLRILLRLLQLRTLENPWTAEAQERRRRTTVDRSGGEHLDGISKLCETIVLRLNAYVSSLAECAEDERDLFSAFVQAVQGENGGFVDLESRLITVPLMEPCRRNLELDAALPRLPPGLFGLCGYRLKIFEYSSPPARNDNVGNGGSSEAVVLLMDMGRMCDDVLADLIQAVDSPPSTWETLRLMVAPALYRVMSISTRYQSHRLLTHALPMLSRLWGGPSEPNLYWDNLDQRATNSQLPTLGSYWERFTRNNRDLDNDLEITAAAPTLLKNVQDCLDILVTLETVLRFSLEPLPFKNMASVLQVYRAGLGYDMMSDQVASLVQSSLKSLKIEWTTAPLDHLLYCFMTVCKMSNIVDSQHQDSFFLNRLTPQSELGPPPLRPTDDSSSTDEVNWQSTYSNFMSQPLDAETRRQLDVARAKARDELVLMAMNLSEALVSQQDSFYGTLPPVPDETEGSVEAEVVEVVVEAVMDRVEEEEVGTVRKRVKQ